MPDRRAPAPGRDRPAGHLGREDEPTLVELRVWREGSVIHRELCESMEEAEAAAERWNELENVECEISEAGAAPDESSLEPPAETDEADRRQG